jgi:hypothetical protein
MYSLCLTMQILKVYFKFSYLKNEIKSYFKTCMKLWNYFITCSYGSFIITCLAHTSVAAVHCSLPVAIHSYHPTAGVFADEHYTICLIVSFQVALMPLSASSSHSFPVPACTLHTLILPGALCMTDLQFMGPSAFAILAACSVPLAYSLHSVIVNLPDSYSLGWLLAKVCFSIF